MDSSVKKTSLRPICTWCNCSTTAKSGYVELVPTHAIMKTLVLCADMSRDVKMFLDYAEHDIFSSDATFLPQLAAKLKKKILPCIYYSIIFHTKDKNHFIYSTLKILFVKDEHLFTE